MLSSIAAGCATTVIPPPHPHDPVPVYLTDYGRHSSLLLPSERGGYDEYAFGDWEFFAIGNARWWIGLRAILNSPQSTLGRRHIDAAPGTLTAEALGANRLATIRVARSRAEALKLNLDQPFSLGQSALFYSEYSLLYHVPDGEHYWLMNNCNHVTARWLKDLGCQVRGPAIFSKFVVQDR